MTTPDPADVIIATTAKPLIETDLRENFRPFLQPDQLADLEENGHSYEQNSGTHPARTVSLSLSTMRPPLKSYAEKETKLEKPLAVPVGSFLKKSHHQPESFTAIPESAPYQNHNNLLDNHHNHLARFPYLKPLFRESLQESETNRAEFVTTSTPLGNNYVSSSPSAAYGDKHQRKNSKIYQHDPVRDHHQNQRLNSHGHISSRVKFRHHDEAENEIESSSREYSGGNYSPKYSTSINQGYTNYFEDGSNNDVGDLGSSTAAGVRSVADDEELEENGITSSGEDNPPWLDKPGVRFPVYGSIPKTSFNCSHQLYKGPFADMETGCQVQESNSLANIF